MLAELQVDERAMIGRDVTLRGQLLQFRVYAPRLPLLSRFGVGRGERGQQVRRPAAILYGLVRGLDGLFVSADAPERPREGEVGRPVARFAADQIATEP